MRSKEEIKKRYDEVVEKLNAYTDKKPYDHEWDELNFSQYVLHALIYHPMTEEEIKREIRVLELDLDENDICGCNDEDSFFREIEATVCIETYRWALNE